MGPLEQVVFKATGSTTGGAFELLELRVQPGGGPPDRCGSGSMTRRWTRCSGALRFRLGDQRFTATAGTYVYVERGEPHTFANPGTTAATALVLVRPAGMQGFFERLGPLLFGAPDEAEIARISAEYACEDAPPLAINESGDPTVSR